MAVDPKDFLFRHGEKVVFVAGIVLFVAVVGLKAVPDDEIGELQQKEKRAREDMERLIAQGRAEAKEQVIEAPPIAEQTRAEWRPAIAFPTESQWAFYASPEVQVQIDAPPQEHVIRGPENLAVQATQTRVTLQWSRPAAKFTDESESDPAKASKTVAQIVGYVVYRWRDADQKSGKGGMSAENLYKVVRTAGDPGGPVDWSDSAGLEPNEVYYYQVTALSDNMAAERGKSFDDSGSALQESAEATDVVNVQIPDNVEITLLSVSELGDSMAARIRVRKNIEGSWWVSDFGLVREGHRIGKARTFAKTEGGTAGDKPVDMTTKYVLKEIKADLVPRMTTQTFYMYEFTVDGEKKQDWAANQEDLMKRYPTVGSVQPLPDPNGVGLWKKEEQVEMVDPRTGEPSMVKKWKILVENTEARPGQKSEYWFAEQGSE